jgi:hypothetical protein
MYLRIFEEASTCRCFVLHSTLIELHLVDVVSPDNWDQGSIVLRDVMTPQKQLDAHGLAIDIDAMSALRSKRRVGSGKLDVRQPCYLDVAGHGKAAGSVECLHACRIVVKHGKNGCVDAGGSKGLKKFDDEAGATIWIQAFIVEKRNIVCEITAVRLSAEGGVDRLFVAKG